MIRTEKIAGSLYLATSLLLALFCLFQSHKLGHDQRARDLAGRTIRSENSAPDNSLMPVSGQQSFENLKKKLGEGTD